MIRLGDGTWGGSFAHCMRRVAIGSRGAIRRQPDLGLSQRIVFMMRSVYWRVSIIP